MHTHHEIEFKTMLTKEEYLQLLTQYSYTSYTQSNFYLDTPDGHFAKEKVGCRIRLKPDGYEVTLKKPMSDHTTEERNFDITEEQYHTFWSSKDLSFVLPELKGPLVVIGSIKTNRHELPFKQGVLMLDHSTFHHIEDFELEYEVNEVVQGKEDFLTFLDLHHLPYRPAEKKLVRMLNSLPKNG